ncbi:MAG: peptide deformylase [Pyramidobacter sp.]|nr:peptide deformylase [Pyramidobacter sp.]
MELRIVEYPNPVLRKETEPVTEFNEDLKVLVDQMILTMKEHDGVGLAAPQVGISKRLAVVVIEDKRYVLVNPKIVEQDGIQQGDEGCLSFPGVFGMVKRSNRVVVECQNENGEPVRYEADGFVARAFQHEIDHLDGKLMIDRFSPMKRELVKKRLEKKGYDV